VLIPRILGTDPGSPEELDRALRAGVRGNPFARAALDTAAWDLDAARRGTGLAALLGERLRCTPAADIPCGVALGIPQDRSTGTLRRWIASAVSHGYRRVKIKVAPGWDVEPVDAARRELAGTGLPLTVDGNGAFEWPEHEPALRAMDDAELLYIEQPLHPDELVGHARLAERLHTPVCLDETLRDARAARQVLELGGPLVWNVKVHRIGGLSEVVRIVDLARQGGARLWAGTMPESGLGSQAALAAASLPEFVYPSDLEPSSRWFGPGRDVVELSMSAGGRMAVPGRSIERLLVPGRLLEASTPLLDLPAQAR
jgi:O-succinylbenzoate synthase